ncbi:MAG: nucleoside diphosphate kinase regulator [Bdellovibrionaceae bacterium]|nr:nucleoside diphosphate kinase regulator [Pseudobdellovibrionaceae bacterium]
MKDQPILIISHEDCNAIMAILSRAEPSLGQLLEEELSRATLVESSKLPSDRVSMNSRVTFQDMESGKESTVSLVFPHEASAEKNYISVLAPIGSALIGLCVGQEIKWPVPGGKSRLVKVVAVSKTSHHE